MQKRNLQLYRFIWWLIVLWSATFIAGYLAIAGVTLWAIGRAVLSV